MKEEENIVSRMRKEQKKIEYWNHFLSINNYWGYGVTLKRLEKVKPHIWNDDDFWGDILLRHGGNKQTPEELSADKFWYDHCFSNFGAMVYQALIENKIIKP